MNGWSASELERIGRADEVGVASRREDGSMRGFVTIWAVRVDDDVYVRSAHGSGNPWFQRALRSGEGRVRAGGTERDVAFVAAGPESAAAVTSAYHAKYDPYGSQIVGTVVSPEAEQTTLRLVPR